MFEPILKAAMDGKKLPEPMDLSPEEFSAIPADVRRSKRDIRPPQGYEIPPNEQRSAAEKEAGQVTKVGGKSPAEVFETGVSPAKAPPPLVENPARTPTAVAPAQRAHALAVAGGKVKAESDRRLLQAVKEAAEDPNPQQADARLTELAKKQSELERDRADALNKALHAKDYTDEEKVAVALMSLLPTLIGGIAGGAAAGKTGAAAGVAGGLQGSVQGTEMLAAGKEKEKEQALAQADKAGSRIDKLDQEILQRQHQIDAMTEGASKRKAEAALEDKKLKSEEIRSKEHNATQIRTAQISAGPHWAALAAKGEGKGAALKEGDKAMYENTAAALRNLNELEGLVKKHGAFESTSKFSPFSDPEAGAKLDQLGYDTAVAYAKIVDPASVAREGEVEAAKKYAIPLGLTVSPKATIAAIRHMRGIIAQRANTASQIGIPVPPEAAAQLQKQEQLTTTSPVPVNWHN